MINDDDFLKSHRERIELHKRNLEERTFRSTGYEKPDKSSFVFQTTISLFIFTFLIILKLTNMPLTNDVLLKIDKHLTSDNLPKIISFAEYIKTNEDAFSNINFNDSIIENDTEENIENLDYPITEFTIDENMLTAIQGDENLLGKK